LEIVRDGGETDWSSLCFLAVTKFGKLAGEVLKFRIAGHIQGGLQMVAAG
jgi:hypothetical protein